MFAKNNTIYKYSKIILFIKIIISIKVLFLKHNDCWNREDIVIFRYFFSFVSIHNKLNVTDYVILLASIIFRCSYLEIMFLFM